VSERITVEIETSTHVRYHYLDGVVPHPELAEIAEESFADPDAVAQVPGATSFDFVTVILFPFEGRVLRHVLAEPETYFWGTEVTRDELADAGYPEARTTSHRFVLTTSGAIIPLRDHESVISPEVYVE